MIELTLRISDIDYASILSRLGGGANPMASAALAFMSDSQREATAVNLLNKNAPKVMSELEKMARDNGIGLKITGARARGL